MEIIVWLLIILVIVKLIMKSKYGARIKGELGERSVNRKLRKCGTLFENYIVKDKNGNTHQIDSILVNHKGVYVIETKNYSGRIYGNDEQQYWTQVLAYGKVKNKLYNPVKQNKTHCYFVEKMLGRDIKVFNVVVLVGNNTKYLDSIFAINKRGLKLYVNSGLDVYDDYAVEKIVNILQYNRDTKTTNKEHINNVRNMQIDIENNICPRCGGHLVLRHGKYGDFYGCSNYPKCKFIKKD